MVNAAVIGLGWWGRHVVSRLKGRNEKLNVVLGVDVRPDGAREFARSHGLEFTDDYRAAVERPDIDAVILTTPHALHEEQAVLAAGAGRHVFCEKPLSLTRDSAERMAAACKRAGVVLGIGHERRFEPAMMELNRLLTEGALGTIMHVEAAFSHDKLAALTPDDWRASSEHGPAVAMTGMGIHLTDAWIQMFGPVERVYAQRERRVTEIPTGDVVCVQARFRTGATGFLSAILVTPLFMRYHVFGSTGWAEVTDSEHPDDPCHAARISVRTRAGDRWSREFHGADAVVANLEAFADAVAGAVPYPVPVDQMIENVALLEAIGRSFESGRVEQVS
jgi:predicted dehydrogenase